MRIVMCHVFSVMCMSCVYLAVSHSLCLESVVSPAPHTLHYARKCASLFHSVLCRSLSTVLSCTHHVHSLLCLTPWFRKCTTLSCSVLCHAMPFHQFVGCHNGFSWAPPSPRLRPTHDTIYCTYSDASASTGTLYGILEAAVCLYCM